MSLINGFGGPVNYGTQCLHPNDDGSSAAIDLTPAFPAGLRFFDRTHTQTFVNTNGNITFSGALRTYTPRAFPVAAQPMIAPYWGDVDIRNTTGSNCRTGSSCENPSENGVWWYLEPGRMVVTWDRVGYFSCHNDLRMSFQLILTASGCGGAGDFDVEFRFNRCEWTTGDASGGTGGFGGTPSQSGFDAGNSIDFVEIPGSRTGDIHNILCRDSNVAEPGIWRFQIRGGAVLCPDAGEPCDTGLVGVCGEGLTNCVGSGTECVAAIEPSPERCDALDNDCDGESDEEYEGDEPLCDHYQVCDRGICVDRCSEFGCPEGQLCAPRGVCVDAACVDTECEPGQVCIDGLCVSACDGVICPHGQSCRGGRCLDLCETFTCDDCTVCIEGVCEPRCQYVDCPAGEICAEDGSCIPADCVDVPCPEGSFCRGGACVDGCEGAVCPRGEICEFGECIPAPDEPDPPIPDAGPGEPDSGPDLPDSGPDPLPDSGPDPLPDAGSDAGADSGWDPDDYIVTNDCRCTATGARSSSGWVLLGLLSIFFVIRLRRS